MVAVGLGAAALKASALAEAGRVAEAGGMNSIWLGEHLFAPVNLESEYLSGAGKQPFALDAPMLDPLLALSHISSVTARIRLGTGIYLLPLRHPLLVSKLIATLDALSNGRLDFGYGSGWMKEEFDAVNVDFEKRGALLDESLEVMNVLFSEERPSISTEHFSVPPMGFEPKPTTSRIIGGGYSPVAWRRAAKADGWYGRVDRLHPSTNGSNEWRLDAVREFAQKMRERVDRAGGDADAYVLIGAIYSTATPEQLEQLGEAGFDEIIVDPFPKVDGRQMGTTASLDALSSYLDELQLPARV